MEPLIFDGAFGTYFAQRGGRGAPELANIARPDDVLEIHREYIEAGAQAIKTNTFAANLGLDGDFDRIKEILEKGWELAKRAAEGENVRVFADLGPIYSDGAAEEYIRLADVFLDLGARDLLFETLNDAAALKDVIAHIRRRAQGCTVIASFAVGQDGYTKTGHYYKTLLTEAEQAGADHVGLNCICGPAHMLRLIKDIPTGRHSLAAMPNAGYPTIVNSRTVYQDNPEYFADKLCEMYAYGADIVGGCCGTTPEHIRLAAELMKKTKRISAPVVESVKRRVEKPRFKQAVIAVELSAPVDTDTEYILSASAKAKESGADFITVPDSPMGKTRANSFMISAMIERRVQIKTIPHVCCRDKNQIAIKGDLLAANIENVDNVLAITGDSVTKTDRNDAKNVFNFNSYKLIEFIRGLNETVFEKRPYNICAALNINAANFGVELERARRKIESGAVCLLTQPIFSEENIKNYLLAKEKLDCRILAGVMLLAGYKNALFLNNEVPGVEIPESVIDSLRDKGAEETKKICVDYAINIADRVSDGCDGYYIMTPLKKIDFSAQVVKYLRRK